MAKILLNRNSDGAEFSLEDDLILSAYTDSDSVTNIEYMDDEDGYRKQIKVSESLASLGAVSKNLVSATLAVNTELVVDSGDASGTTAFKLVDAGQNFTSTVTVGMRVKNTSKGTFATVLAVDSATQLSLNNDIMVSGDDFEIYSLAGTSVWINKERVTASDEREELGFLFMDLGGTYKKRFELATNLTTWKNEVITKEGNVSYAVDSYTAAPNTIILTTATGDVEDKFVTGDVVTVFDEKTANDGIYTVVSATFAGGQTTVTVTETPTAATARGGYLRVETAAEASLPSFDPGVANTGVTASHASVDGKNFVSTFTVSQTDALTTGDNAALADGYLIYTFPSGAVVIDYAYMTMSMTATTEQAADTPDVGLGTVIASGANALLSATATFENIITGQTAADASGTATVKTALPTAGTPFIIEAGDAHTLHFNVADTWADDTSGDLTADIAGTITVAWRKMA
jgi:hypothetical protein